MRNFFTNYMNAVQRKLLQSIIISSYLYQCLPVSVWKKALN